MLLVLDEQALCYFEIFVTICQSTRPKVFEEQYSQQLRSEKLNEILYIFVPNSNVVFYSAIEVLTEVYDSICNVYDTKIHMVKLFNECQTGGDR